MPVVHTSTYIPNQILLEIDKIPQNLRECAKELLVMAERYQRMADVIEQKNIKITAVDGSADTGSFTLLDDIEASRLRTADCLVDMRHSQKLKEEAEKEPDSLKKEELLSKIPENSDHCFYIDPAVDQILSKVAEETSQNFEHYDHDCEHEHTEHVYSDDDFEGFQDKLNIPFTPELESPDFDKSSLGGFSMHVQDLGQPLQSVKFDPNKKVFTFYCSDCEVEHQESINGVYNSLKSVTSLVSQLQFQNKSVGPGIGEAFQVIEDNLRLIQYLLEQYHLDK